MQATAYAIRVDMGRNTFGYLAAQGGETWIQPEANGWGVYGTAGAAEQVATSEGIEGYRVVEVPNPFLPTEKGWE